jgi:hypothetical protein
MANARVHGTCAGFEFALEAPRLSGLPLNQRTPAESVSRIIVCGKEKAPLSPAGLVPAALCLEWINQSLGFVVMGFMLIVCPILRIAWFRARAG